MIRRGAGAAAVVTVVGGVAAISTYVTGTAHDTVRKPSTTGVHGVHQERALQLAPEFNGTYRRDQFGRRWFDVDGNGCNQRDDVLARDLVDVVKRGRCDVVAGVLHDPYTGRSITFTKSDSEAVQIDHIVSLAEAWRSGAHSWTAAQREEFANDVSNLLAVDGPTNKNKRSSGINAWTPPNPASTSAYIERYLEVKKIYGLSVDPREVRSLLKLLLETALSKSGRA